MKMAYDFHQTPLTSKIMPNYILMLLPLFVLGKDAQSGSLWKEKEAKAFWREMSVKPLKRAQHVFISKRVIFSASFVTTNMQSTQQYVTCVCV